MILPVEPTAGVPIALPESIPVGVSSTDPQGGGEIPPLQETYNEQEALPPDILASTTEVILATSTAEFADVPEEVPVTEEEILSTEELPPDEVLLTEELPVEVVPETLPQDVLPEPQSAEVVVPQQEVSISLKELEPKPEFVLSVNTGKKVPAKRMVKRQVFEHGKMMMREEVQTITTEPQLSVDQDGRMTISGQCLQKYYVVMVYRNATDYDRDRASAIVNRAYECEGGSFTYRLDRLPNTLPDGTYFILIGEQGETGTWVPSSALMEVTINRNIHI
jgi:hypothetical protein